MLYTELSEFVGSPLPSGEVEALMEQLSEPFDPKYIDWKPQVKSRDGKKAMAAAYADIRAYIDRLNKVVGREKWAHSIEIKTVDYSSGKGGDGSMRSKVVVIVAVAISGVGIGIDVGESPTDDPNAFTSAFAQAFKRACVQFGLGRYLYDIESRWYELDEYGQWVKGKEPQLPDWAIPSVKKRQAVQKDRKPAQAAPKSEAASKPEPDPEIAPAKPPVVELPDEPARIRGSAEACSECGQQLQDAVIKGKPYTAAQIAASALKKFNRVVCAGCALELLKQAEAKIA